MEGRLDSLKMWIAWHQEADTLGSCVKRSIGRPDDERLGDDFFCLCVVCVCV